MANFQLSTIVTGVINNPGGGPQSITAQPGDTVSVDDYGDPSGDCATVTSQINDFMAAVAAAISNPPCEDGAFTVQVSANVNGAGDTDLQAEASCGDHIADPFFQYTTLISTSTGCMPNDDGDIEPMPENCCSCEDIQTIVNTAAVDIVDQLQAVIVQRFDAVDNVLSALSESVTTGVSDIQNSVGSLNDVTQAGFTENATKVAEIKTLAESISSKCTTIEAEVAASILAIGGVAAIVAPLQAAIFAEIAASQAAVITEVGIVGTEVGKVLFDTARILSRVTSILDDAIPSLAGEMRDRFDAVDTALESIPMDTVQAIVESLNFKVNVTCYQYALDGNPSGHGLSTVGTSTEAYAHFGYVRWKNNNVGDSRTLHQWVVDREGLLIAPTFGEDWVAELVLYNGVTPTIFLRGQYESKGEFIQI